LVEQRTHGHVSGTVTERCVFQLAEEGLELIEVAPGVDIEKDILAHMPFPVMREVVRTMHSRIFSAEPMNLKAMLIARFRRTCRL
jgi:propionate CoA-transferase